MAGKASRPSKRPRTQQYWNSVPNAVYSTDEPRRSGRATKGQHTKNHEEGPPPKKKGKKGGKATASEAEENGDDDAIVRCICGDTEDYRGWMMIVCDQCDAWQHNYCMDVTEDESKLPDQYFCEQCRPQNHKELVAAMKRGEKPWEEKIRRREEEEAQKKKKGSRKSKGGRASAVGDHAEASPRASATPSVQPEVGSKRKAPDLLSSAARPASPAVAHPPSATSPISGPRRKSTFDDASLKRRKSVVEDTTTKRRKASVGLARRDSTLLPPVASIDQLPDERRKGAEALQKTFKSQIDASVKHHTYRVPDGETPTVIANNLTLQVEYALYQRFISEEEKNNYAEQFRTILFNTKKNKSLTDRLLDLSLSPEELANMASEEMASEELQREREKIKEEADKQAVLVQETGPRYKKTHKGEELVGGFDGTRSQEEIGYAPMTTEPSTAGQGSPLTANGDGKEPLALNTTGHDRKASTNFDIQQIFSNVRSPEVTQGGFSQPSIQTASQASGAAPKRSPGEDADIDRLLRDEDMMDASPELRDPANWRGTLAMQGPGGSSFAAIGRYVGGADMSHHMPYNQLLPAHLEISGRISIPTADEYVAGHRHSASTQVCILQLIPLAGMDDSGMASIFNYLHAKERWGCIKNPDLHKDIKDVYVVLLEAGMGPLPSFMQALEDLNIESPRPHNGLYIVFMIKTQASPPRDVPDGSGMDYQMDGRAPSTSTGPEATPTMPPASTPVFSNSTGLATPAPEPTFNPTPEQHEVLGEYVDCTTVRQLIMGGAALNDTQLKNLRHILERDPAARDDLMELSRHLQARKKEVEEAGAPSV